MNKSNWCKCFSYFNFVFQVSIDGNDSVSSTGIIGENEQDKKMQVCAKYKIIKSIYFFCLFCPARCMIGSPVAMNYGLLLPFRNCGFQTIQIDYSISLCTRSCHKSCKRSSNTYCCLGGFPVKR